MIKPIFIVWLVMSAFLFAQNYPSYPVGQNWNFPDARALSLAGAGSVSLTAPGALLYNPAALAQINRSLSVDLTLASRKMEERRSYPLYDRFDSYLVNSTYALNNNWYTQPQGALAVKLPFLKKSSLTIAAGIYNEMDYRYSYLEEVRQNVFGDPIIGYNRINIDGMLQRYTVGFAMHVPSLPGLSLGIQAGILDGTNRYQMEINYLDARGRVVLGKENRKLSNTPLTASAGAIYRLSERVSLGGDVFLPYTLKYKVTDAEEDLFQESIGYPLRLNAGFEYRARQELQARLNLDLGYEFWSKREYTRELTSGIITLPDFSDVLYVKAGIEHIFFNKIPFGLGAQYRNSNNSRGNTQTLLSVGTGFFDRQWRIDVAGALSRLNYRWADLFDDKWFVNDPNFVSRTALDTVDETYFFVQLSFKYLIDF